MLNPHGYVSSSGPDQSYEADTVQCAHCGKHYEIRPRESPSAAGGYCGRCAAPICTRCGVTMGRTLKCAPFERRLEITERADVARRRLSKELGL